MKALCPAAGVAASKVFPHNLRHLFAKCFYDACRDLVKLADVLGHSSVETTRIYLLSTGTQHVKLLDRLGLVGETKFTFCLKLSHFVHSDEMPNLVQTNGRKDSSPKREAE